MYVYYKMKSIVYCIHIFIFFIYMFLRTSFHRHTDISYPIERTSESTLQT